MATTNAYTLNEIRKIFEACTTHDEIDKACLAFRWLIQNNFQQRSHQLQAISLIRFSQIIKKSDGNN